MPPNFQNGKIYSIRSHQTDKIYIGSTTQSLAVRFGGHKKPSNTATSREILLFDDAYIELIELFPCDSKMALNLREGEIIRERDCVNKIVAGRTKAQWLEDNKEHVHNRRKQYYEDNKTVFAEKHKEYYESNKPIITERMTKYRDENKEELDIKKKHYYYSNKAAISEHGSLYRNANKEKIKARGQKYYLENKDTIKEKVEKYRAEKKNQHNCECGSIINGGKQSRDRHYGSTIHKDYVLRMAGDGITNPISSVSIEV